MVEWHRLLQHVDPQLGLWRLCRGSACGVSPMSCRHTQPAHRAPLASMGLQPGGRDISLESPRKVCIHVVPHSSDGLPPRCASCIGAGASGHRAVDSPSHVVDLHREARRPSPVPHRSHCCSSARRARRITAPTAGPLAPNRGALDSPIGFL